MRDTVLHCSRHDYVNVRPVCEQRLDSGNTTTRTERPEDCAMKALINTIQTALFGGDLSQLGQDLSGVYRQAWETIRVGVETGGVDPQLLALIVHNTRAVLGPAADQHSAWRDNLADMRHQATAQGAPQLAALLDAIIGLLDANGDPAGLGQDLEGIYARTWQAIVGP